MRLSHLLLTLFTLIDLYLNNNINNKDKFLELFSKYANTKSKCLLNSYIQTKNEELVIEYYLDDEIYTYSDFYKWKIIESLLNSLDKKEITVEDFNNVIKNKSSIISPP